MAVIQMETSSGQMDVDMLALSGAGETNLEAITENNS